LPEFFQNCWAGATVWAALFVSDYALTITCAKLYQKGVREKIVLEGSYEITPYFQRDIDSLRLVSPRFLFVLVLYFGALVLLWGLTGETRELYSLVLGAMILVQFAIHTRHVHNFFLFRAATGEAVRGRIEYSRKLTLRISSLDLFTFSALYILLFACTRSWFILGGAVGCLSVSFKHWRLARQRVSTETQTEVGIAKAYL
jgi:hypothetical protein